MGKNTGPGDNTQSGQGSLEVGLLFDKTFLNFFAGVGKISTQSLTLTNRGKTTVYFDWKRGPPNILFEFEKTDYAEYFHIHNGKEVIKPGEQKTYTFTFYSTLPGQFHAQYYIDTDPKLPEELPPIELSGFAVVSDKNITNRYEFDENVRDYHVERFCSEIVEDVFQHVRTPTPPLPDYRILENRIREFEAQNKHLGLFYSEVSYQLFLLLQKHVVERSGLNPHTHAWGFQAAKIKQWIDEMPTSIDKTLLTERWEEIVHISKKKPVDKSPSYQMFKTLLSQVATKLPDMNEKALEAQGLAKKKFKNEDEEQKFFAAHKDKLAEDLAALVGEDLQTDEEFARKRLILDDKDLRFIHGPGYFDKLGRIKLFKDSEVESKRVLAKFSLKVKTAQFLELKTPKVQHEEEADKKDPKKKGAADIKKDPKDAKPDPKKAKPGAGKVDEEESSKPVPLVKVKIGLDMIEEKSLEVFLKSVKSIQSRTPKLLMVLVTLEDAEILGTDPEEVSIRFLLDKLNSYLETKVIWEKNWVIPDWADRLENEVYPEEGVILFENLALWPLELGYEVLEDPTAKQIALNPNIASSAVASGADLVSKPAVATKPGATASTSAAPLAASAVIAPTVPATRRFRCLYSHIAEGARVLSQYANTFIFDDPTNFGRRDRLSNIYIKPDHFGFGRMVTDRLSFVLGFFKSLPGRSTLLLGGQLTNSKLMFLQACGHLFQNIILAGEIGFAISSWATTFQPGLEAVGNYKDRFYREFLSALQEKTNVVLPKDAYVLPPSIKEEQAAPTVGDPKKKPADPKDPKAVKDEISQVDEVGTIRAALVKGNLHPHEMELLSKHQKAVSFSHFDLARVEEYEAMLREEAEQKKREEAARLEQERIKREEEAAKDPKKKAGAAPEKPKEPAGKKPDAKPGVDGVKTSTNLEGSHLSREIPPYRTADGKNYFTSGMTGVSWGQETKQEVMKAVSHSNNLFWLGKLECSHALHFLDKDVAKALKNMRTAADTEEATLNADARERYVPLKIGIVGENLMSLVNSFDLKDPPPPKEAKRRAADDEDGEGEEEQEEEPEEDSEEEEDFDDDMSSGQIRRLRKKDNVDQITGLYQPDERSVLQLLSGELLEELDRVDQTPKVVVDPDDIPFAYLADI